MEDARVSTAPQKNYSPIALGQTWAYFTDEYVKRALRDTYPDFDGVEIDGTLDDDGKTLREKLADRKRKNRDDPKNFPLGKAFHDENKAIYSSQDSPLKKLNVAQPFVTSTQA